MKPLILASASPRRKALLGALGLTFEVTTSHALEIDEGSSPEEIVLSNARRKRDEVAERLHRDAIIIAADTLVFLDQHVLSKPKDVAEAHTMLRMLSGNTHQVVTGLAIIDTGTGQAVEGHECTDVTFRDLSDEEIAHFVHAVNPVDRAGAYTVDGPGSLLVARYNGCYQNVLGLPIVRLDSLLKKLNVSLIEEMDTNKTVFL
ncbi:MAG: Maf-like protein [Candidatus Hydrogenedentota bacterium]